MRANDKVGDSHWGHAHEAFSWWTPAPGDETHPNSQVALADFSRRQRAQLELSASAVSPTYDFYYLDLLPDFTARFLLECMFDELPGQALQSGQGLQSGHCAGQGLQELRQTEAVLTCTFLS